MAQKNDQTQTNGFKHDYLSTGVFGMKRPLIPFVDEASIERKMQFSMDSEEVFGSSLDLMRAQDSFEKSKLSHETELRDLASLFLRLWDECRNVTAFAYLKSPLLSPYLTKKLRDELKPFQPTSWAKEQVEILDLLRNRPCGMTQDQKKIEKGSLQA